jgi:hypothetical protein
MIRTNMAILGLTCTHIRCQSILFADIETLCEEHEYICQFSTKNTKNNMR